MSNALTAADFPHLYVEPSKLYYVALPENTALGRPAQRCNLFICGRTPVIAVSYYDNQNRRSIWLRKLCFTPSRAGYPWDAAFYAPLRDYGCLLAATLNQLQCQPIGESYIINEQFVQHFTTQDLPALDTLVHETVTDARWIAE